MRGAKRLGRLQVTVSIACIAAIGAGTVAVLSSVSLATAPLAVAAAACEDLLFSRLGVVALAALLLPWLAALVVVQGVRSLLRQLRATRRHLRSLRPSGEIVRIGSSSCIVVRDSDPLAFCAGLLRPRIYLSDGAVRSLSEAELEAVVAHERQHQRAHDPLRLLALRTLADALPLIPALRAMSSRHAVLIELAADDAAVAAIGSRATLASALLRFTVRPSPEPGAAVVGIAADRIDHLSGDPRASRWRLPGRALGASAAGAALILGAASTLSVGGAPSGGLVQLAAESCIPAIATVATAALLAMTLTLKRCPG